MNIEIDAEVQKKAKKIIAYRKAVLHKKIDEYEYLHSCFIAEICPFCGDKVKTNHEKRRNGFLSRKNYRVQNCHEHGRVNERE